MEEVDTLIQRINATEDFFEILEVERSADEAFVRKSYKRLSLKVHPDKCQHDGAEEAFKKLSRAYACLRDPQERAYYERVGVERNQKQIFRPDEIFKEVFEEMQRQQGMNGGSSFTFVGNSAGRATVINFSPSEWLREVPLLGSLIGFMPPQLVSLAITLGFLYFASLILTFFMAHLFEFLVVAFLVPHQFKGYALLAVVFAGMAIDSGLI